MKLKWIAHPIKAIKSTYAWSTYCHFCTSTDCELADPVEECIGGPCEGCEHQHKPHKPRLLFFICKEVWWRTAQWFTKNIICRFKGHDYEDTGYATPNTGAMGLECRRCGHGGTTVLY